MLKKEELKIKYRPYTYKELIEALATKRTGYIKNCVFGDIFIIEHINGEQDTIKNVQINNVYISFQHFLENFTWLDNEPCGVKI